MKRNSAFILCLFLIPIFCSAQKKSEYGHHSGSSFYPLKMEDAQAVYFTPEKFGIKADGSTDVSDALQKAINDLKTTDNFGVLFIPEGTYLISKTIYIPTAIRLIGYGKNRPLIKLAKNSPGFQTADTTDKGKAKYMFWFVSGLSKPGEPVHDAGASTFYASMSNINLEIEDGNPQAVALRTHYAQHSFVAHLDIHIGNGKAGMFDVGNEMEDVRFFGGDYGIYTTKASPGWQFMMVDSYFEGQRKAAIKTREGGLTVVRMNVRHVPTVVEIEKNYWEKLIMTDCRFEDVNGPAFILNGAGSPSTEISLRNIVCRNVPEFASYPDSARSIKAPATIYRVSSFTDGLALTDVNAEGKYERSFNASPLTSLPEPVATDVPTYAAMKTWVNLKDFGAKGDGKTDDTKAIQNALDAHATIYVPQGWYMISNTIKLQAGKALIGLNPISTQFILADNTEAFGSFGAPVPMVEAQNGDGTILSGIGVSTAASNPRAVGVKWMAGAHSYLNDVKFIGGHGNLTSPRYQAPPPIYQMGKEVILGGNLWDTQYWSLWVTNGGGGVFKNIWTANTFATSGAYISNTSTRGRVYALSIEHHVRNEIRFNGVSNWNVYALQTEEESRESSECQPVELENCDHMIFGNLYMFRVIRVVRQYPYSVRDWGSKKIEFLNVHNYSQIKYTTDNPLYEVNADLDVRPREFARLFISGDVKSSEGGANWNGVKRLATGFDFAEGMARDSKGNLYFCDSRMKRIYSYTPGTGVKLLADYPWEPLSLACDKNDHLIVVFKYVPKAGYLLNGKAEEFVNAPDADGTSFSKWGNNGFATFVYSFDPANPDETIHLLHKQAMGSVPNVYKALYPAHRWRDGHDFNQVTVNRPSECWVADDGVTIIPVVYDLARSASVVEAFPGKPLYVSDEYNERTAKLDVSKDGYVSNLSYFSQTGEFDNVVDKTGNVYIADGQIYVYSADGKEKKLIQVPERPSSIVLGGQGDKTLYVTGRKSLFSISLKP